MSNFQGQIRLETISRLFYQQVIIQIRLKTAANWLLIHVTDGVCVSGKMHQMLPDPNDVSLLSNLWRLFLTSLPTGHHHWRTSKEILDDDTDHNVHIKSGWCVHKTGWSNFFMWLPTKEHKEPNQKLGCRHEDLEGKEDHKNVLRTKKRRKTSSSYSWT